MGVNNLVITGGIPLHGTIEIQGSKNAVLPILAACLPGEGVCILENCPRIRDVEDTLQIMKTLGCKVVRSHNMVQIDASGLRSGQIEGPEAARIRSSILFLGALLGKMGEAAIPLPGGCAIGARPIDLHLKALRALGAEFVIEEKVSAFAEHLHGGWIDLPIPSVGATENAILAAVMAEGETEIRGGAREPEIEELCTFLRLRGAHIWNQADGSIRICGGNPLGPARYRMKADRIVAGTYLLAAAATEGSICIRNFPAGELDALLEVLRKTGAQIQFAGQKCVLEMISHVQAVPYTETAPFPGFPTDLQSPLMAALCRAQGSSCICETVFENRFRVAEGLVQMGARIDTFGRCARIEGVGRLHPARMDATDLRGGAALVIAALQAEGRSVIGKIGYIERGYEDICRDLRQLGAKIECVPEDLLTGRIEAADYESAKCVC